MPIFRPERAAAILMDAIRDGDVSAAEKWNCSTKTIRNYRKRLEDDPHFSAFFRTVRAKRQVEWETERGLLLQEATAKLRELVAMANEPRHIQAVAKALETVSNVDVTHKVLDESGDDSEGPAAEEAAGGHAGRTSPERTPAAGLH